jgi:hypothetical protein
MSLARAVRPPITEAAAGDVRGGEPVAAAAGVLEGAGVEEVAAAAGGGEADLGVGIEGGEVVVLGQFQAAGVAQAQQGIGEGGALEVEGVGAARLKIHGKPVPVAGQLEVARQAAADGEQGAGVDSGDHVVGDDRELAAAAIAAEVAGGIDGLHRQVIGLARGEGIAPGQRPGAAGIAAGGAAQVADRHGHHGRFAHLAAQQRCGVLGDDGGHAHQRRLGVDRELEGAGEGTAATTACLHHLGGDGEAVGAGGFLVHEAPAGGCGGVDAGAAQGHAIAEEGDRLVGAQGLAEGAAECQESGGCAGAAAQVAVDRIDCEGGQGRTDELLHQLLVGGAHAGEGEVLETVPNLIAVGAAEEAGEEERIAREREVEAIERFLEAQPVVAGVTEIDVGAGAVEEAVVTGPAAEGVGGVVAIEAVVAAAAVGCLENGAGRDREVANLAADVGKGGAAGARLGGGEIDPLVNVEVADIEDVVAAGVDDRVGGAVDGEAEFVPEAADGGADCGANAVDGVAGEGMGGAVAVGGVHVVERQPVDRHR